ncbi:transposase [Pandoraea sputorum]|uniref:Transposase n=1 Tax=Pandoraea sputorum TaxID=93222 RepID=A0A5E5BIA8_9BURK|nr:hypothetical protein [Pandoraea sputorum]VVE85078.1 transposase [Pandoraea sputorum]
MSAQDPTADLPPEVLAYIRQREASNCELKASNQQLTQRVEQLEELFRLGQLKRFAPSSEKLKDRGFDEPEQSAAADPLEDDPAGVLALPDTGRPAVDAPSPGKRGRKPLPAERPRTRSEYDLLDEQNGCPCCQHALHRMGEQTCEQLHIERKVRIRGKLNVRFGEVEQARRRCWVVLEL